MGKFITIGNLIINSDELLYCVSTCNSSILFGFANNNHTSNMMDEKTRNEILELISEKLKSVKLEIK